MDRFIIQGGTPLRGSVRVSGSKNAALPMMAASLVASGPLHLKQVPNLAEGSYLTRDDRKVERKKYGHKKARRSFQISKR